VLHPGDDPERVIEHVAIGAMQPRHVLERIGPGSLLIVPGDREDVIHATVAAARHARELRRDPGLLDRFRQRSTFGRAPSHPGRTELAGMLFTGGYPPRQRELDAIRQAGLFAYVVRGDTYAAASEVHDLLVKTHAADRDKIAEIRRLVADHVDVDRLLQAFEPWAPSDHAGMPASRAGEHPSVETVLEAGRRRLRRLGSALRSR
jgi:BioD-like phosphotransacetylase family protein